MPRNGSNGRGKANYSKINMKPPKWATKEYKPVFRMQSEANPNFQSQESSMPNFQTLSQSQSKPLRNQTVSPRSEVPANIRGMNNSFTATPDLNNSMKLSKNKAFMDSAMRKLGQDNEQNFDKEVGFGE